MSACYVLPFRSLLRGVRDKVDRHGVADERHLIAAIRISSADGIL